MPIRSLCTATTCLLLCAPFALAFAQGTERSIPRGSVEPVGPQPVPPLILSYPGIPLTLISDQAPPGENIALRATSSFAELSAGPAEPTAIDATATCILTTGTPLATGMAIHALSDTEVGVAQATGVEMDVDARGILCAVPATGIRMDVTADADDALSFAIDAVSLARGGESGDARGGDFLADATSADPNSSAIGLKGDARTSPSASSFVTCIGVLGRCNSPDGSGVFSSGNLSATGAKTFVQPHPTDAARVVQFVCLEGNESGTYFRGSARLAGGVAEIAIPEEWTLVSEPDGITVQLTPVGAPASLWVAEQGRERIVVRGQPDCAFNYFVNGVRRGFASYAPYRDNVAFRPEVRGVPFGEQYPQALRDVLVENGVLNPDYTPNEETAAALGWKLDEPDDVRISRRWWLAPSERGRLLEERARAKTSGAGG